MISKCVKYLGNILLWVIWLINRLHNLLKFYVYFTRPLPSSAQKEHLTFSWFYNPSRGRLKHSNIASGIFSMATCLIFSWCELIIISSSLATSIEILQRNSSLIIVFYGAQLGSNWCWVKETAKFHIIYIHLVLSNLTPSCFFQAVWRGKINRKRLWRKNSIEPSHWWTLLEQYIIGLIWILIIQTFFVYKNLSDVNVMNFFKSQIYLKIILGDY